MAKQKNLIVQHLGMGWPVGTVVPPDAFPNGYEGHLALGAVAETDYPVTTGVELPEPLKPGDDPVKVNTALRAEIAALNGHLAGARADADKARKEALDAKTEAAELTAEADAMMKAADAKLAAAQQLALGTGPAPVAK